ncbi:hypothetical protein ACFLUS_03400 [Chloroflexota bacterium]
MSYTLRFPFKLAPGCQIDGLEESREFKVDDLSWLFEVNSKLDYYVLKVNGLYSEPACQEFLPHLCSGFNWLLLKRGITAKLNPILSRVTYPPDPEAAARNLEQKLGLLYKGPIDCMVIDDSPSCYPSEKNVSSIAMRTTEVIIGTPVTDVFAFLKEGMDIRRGNPSIDHQKLQLAFDLFSTYWYEYSNNAKLMTLILVLESLMDPPLRHKVVVQLLEKWKPEVEYLKKDFPTDSEEYHALESLEGELLFKKVDSLRRQVRSLVFKSLKFLGHDNPQELAEQAVSVYDERSSLFHNGFLPEPLLSQTTTKAKTIVELVLEAQYKGFAGVD